MTGETANALYRTLVGIVELIRFHFSKVYDYVLRGKSSSHRIEAEFGICRGFSGRNGLIGAKHVINSVKLQRLKLHSKLDVEKVQEDAVDSCCLDSLENSEQKLEQIVSCSTEASNLSVTEKLLLYYICSYVTYKEGIFCLDDSETVILFKETKFTHFTCKNSKLSRGEFKRLSLNLYDFSQ